MFFASWASRLLTILSLICCAYPADLDEKCVMEVEWDWPKDGSFSVLDGGLQGHWSQGIDVHVTTPETRMTVRSRSPGSYVHFGNINWLVRSSGTTETPLTVTGGEALVLYLLPGGAIEFTG